MKKAAALMLVLMLVLSFAGCSSVPENETQKEVRAALEGEWRADDETVRISGNRVEITGYYELDGRRTPGVAVAGTVQVDADGSIRFEIENHVRNARLQDELTLIIDGQEYTK